MDKDILNGLTYYVLVLSMAGLEKKILPWMVGNGKQLLKTQKHLWRRETVRYLARSYSYVSR
jgi:hypothetical protein